MDDTAAQATSGLTRIAVRTTGPRSEALADVIAYAWFGIGIRPRESVVAIQVRGGRLGVVGRVDLPVADDAGVQFLADRLRMGGANRAFVIVVSESPAAERIARQARKVFRRSGFDVLDLVVVAADRYRSLLCRQRGCCPPGGFPLSAVSESPVATAMVVDGRRVATGEADLLAEVLPEPGDGAWPPVRSRVSVAQRRAWLDTWLAACADESAGGPETSAVDVPADTGATGEVGPASLITSGLANWLAPALEDLPTRDAIMATLLHPNGEGVSLAQQVLVGNLTAFDRALATPPGAQQLERARVLLAMVARQAPTGRRAPALAVLGWWAWWQGDGTRARLMIQEALSDNPNHSLAILLDQVLQHGLPPTWWPAGDEVAGECG